MATSACDLSDLFVVSVVLWIVSVSFAVALTVLAPNARESWPTVLGTVATSGYRQMQVWWLENEIRVEPQVTFTYDVDGRQYVGRQRLWQWGFSKKGKDSFLQRYPAGTLVTVQYHPRRPYKSTIEPRYAKPWAWIPVVLATVVVILVLGAAILCMSPSG